MIRAGVLWIVLMGAATPYADGQEDAPSPAGGPTLDDAIYIYSSVDKEEAYLGEAVTLSLEYWELKFRGMKVQPYYNSPQPMLPRMEGFYVGVPRQEQREAARDGGLYTVTTYRSRLYPARAGTLFIGAWAWKGTVRGHTTAGARSLTVDLTTEPIEIQVQPLPAPVATFSGSVGEFDITLDFDSRELTRGEPGSFVLTLTGDGNPKTIQAPPIPEEAWFSVGDPEEEPRPDDGRGGEAFTKQYRFPIMPLAGGAHIFPPVSLTYFSPREGRYKVSRTDPVPLTIESTGPADQLVVIGAAGSGRGPRMESMEEGRLPLVSAIETFRVRRERWNLTPLFVFVPPLVFFVLFFSTRGTAPLRQWAPRRTVADSGDGRLAAVADHPRPFDALNAVARDILADRTGQAVAGMSIPEIRDCVSEVAEPGVPEAVASFFRACEACRYGQGSADLSELIQRARSALGRVPARGRRAR